jgi:hypothetical protein
MLVDEYMAVCDESEGRRQVNGDMHYDATGADCSCVYDMRCMFVDSATPDTRFWQAVYGELDPAFMSDTDSDSDWDFDCGLRSQGRSRRADSSRPPSMQSVTCAELISWVPMLQFLQVSTGTWLALTASLPSRPPFVHKIFLGLWNEAVLELLNALHDPAQGHALFDGVHENDMRTRWAIVDTLAMIEASRGCKVNLTRYLPACGVARDVVKTPPLMHVPKVVWIRGAVAANDRRRASMSKVTARLYGVEETEEFIHSAVRALTVDITDSPGQHTGIADNSAGHGHCPIPPVFRIDIGSVLPGGHVPDVWHVPELTRLPWRAFVSGSFPSVVARVLLATSPPPPAGAPFSDIDIWGVMDNLPTSLDMLSPGAMAGARSSPVQEAERRRAVARARAQLQQIANITRHIHPDVPRCIVQQPRVSWTVVFDTGGGGPLRDPRQYPDDDITATLRGSGLLPRMSFMMGRFNAASVIGLPPEATTATFDYCHCQGVIMRSGSAKRLSLCGSARALVTWRTGRTCRTGVELRPSPPSREHKVRQCHKFHIVPDIFAASANHCEDSSDVIATAVAASQTANPGTAAPAAATAAATAAVTFTQSLMLKSERERQAWLDNSGVLLARAEAALTSCAQGRQVRSCTQYNWRGMEATRVDVRRHHNQASAARETLETHLTATLQANDQTRPFISAPSNVHSAQDMHDDMDGNHHSEDDEEYRWVQAVQGLGPLWSRVATSTPDSDTALLVPYTHNEWGDVLLRRPAYMEMAAYDFCINNCVPAAFPVEPIYIRFSRVQLKLPGGELHVMATQDERTRINYAMKLFANTPAAMWRSEVSDGIERRRVNLTNLMPTAYWMAVAPPVGPLVDGSSWRKTPYFSATLVINGRSRVPSHRLTVMGIENVVSASDVR